MTRYFITGGAGFIGSHLVDRLLADGELVVAFDNLSNSDGRWLQPHQSRDGFRFMGGDVLDLDALCAGMAGADQVVHLASSVDMRKGLADPSFDLTQCAVGTQRVLEAMRLSGVRTIVFSSSSTVYGDPVVVPTAEHHGPLLPISLYGAGKLAAEGLLSAYGHLYGMSTYAFRFGNVVGGRMNHGVIFDFITKLKQDPVRLEILGDGHQAKNYFLVEDCVDGLLTLPQRLGPGSHVTNLGCAGTIEVSRLARVVAEEMGLTDVRFECGGGRRGWPGDVPLVEFDLTKAHQSGWHATTDLEGAVRECARRLLTAWDQLSVPAAESP